MCAVAEDWHSPARLALPSGPGVPLCTEVRDTWLACIITDYVFWPIFRFVLCCMQNNETMIFCKNEARCETATEKLLTGPEWEPEQPSP